MTGQLQVAERTSNNSHGDWDALNTFNDIPQYCTPLSSGMYIYNGPTDKELMNIRHDCLRMAVQHATPDQVNDGTVYKIANDYYDYVTNKNRYQ